MRGFYEQVIAILRENGFVQAPGGKGSHEKWKRGGVTVIVPFNCQSKYTANGVMKGAGLRHRF